MESSREGFRRRRDYALGQSKIGGLFRFRVVRVLETDAIDWGGAAVNALKWAASNSCFAIFVVAVLTGSVVDLLAREAGRSQAMRSASVEPIALDGPYTKGIYRLLTYLEPEKEHADGVR